MEISGIMVIPTGREARPPTGVTAEDPPMAELRLVIALYPGITHLDFTGPHQGLVRTPDAEVVVASLGGRDIAAEGLVFAQLADLAAIPSCDVLLVPGGLGALEVILDEAFLTEIRR